MKIRTRDLLTAFATLLLLSACAAGQPTQNPSPVPESPSGEYIVRTAAAELHIVSPGGRIRIDNLEIDNGKPPLVAQADSSAPTPTANRKAGITPATDSDGDVEDKPVEQVERAAAGEYREPSQKGKLPGKLPE